MIIERMNLDSQLANYFYLFEIIDYSFGIYIVD
jgi:hypothetical protein